MIEEKYKFKIEGETSPLFSYLQKYVQNSYQNLAQNKVYPWYDLQLGKPFKGENYYGTKINYDGIKFEGSPKTIFWENYIEPFLENIVIDAIKEASTLCEKHKTRGKAPYEDLRRLLKIAVMNVYSNMNSICSIPQEDLILKINNLEAYIDKAINNAIKLMPSKKWYTSKTIIAAIITGVFVLVASFFGGKGKTSISDTKTIASKNQTGGVTAEHVTINNFPSSTPSSTGIKSTGNNNFIGNNYIEGHKTGIDVSGDETIVKDNSIIESVGKESFKSGQKDNGS